MNCETGPFFFARVALTASGLVCAGTFIDSPNTDSKLRRLFATLKSLVHRGVFSSPHRWKLAVRARVGTIFAAMFQLRPVIFIRITFAALLLAPLLAFAAGFAHEPRPAPADPGVHWGRLENGLRYALLHKQEPKGRVSARLAVQAGSVYENENQRGLAHFLEHMAFNGSRHFPSASVVEFFQRLGMDFGGDTNASTGFDRTIYQLELPDTRPETLRESPTFFADVAGGLLLGHDEIEKERGVILSEKRARDSVGLRTFLAELEFLVPDTRFPQRLPIGTAEVIKTADRDRFTEFYDAWYRPERMLVVIAGDIDPAAVAPLLQELFSPLTARPPSLRDPRLATVVPPEAVTAPPPPDSEVGNATVHAT